MIAKENLENLLRKNLITIGYSFGISDGKPVTFDNEQIVNPDDTTSVGYQMFNRNFKGDRLSITMGAIAYSHKYKKLKGRINFNKKDSLFDLRQTEGKILIQPGETISVPSNERIRLNDDQEANNLHKEYYGAYILPRLTIADSGLFYVPSYIDPTWDGIMQAVLYNFSDRPVEINICESLAVCRFYKLDGEIDKFFKENFAKHNHHFAQNWKNILEGSKAPILRGKEPIEKEGFFKNNFSWEKIREFANKNLWVLVSGTFLVSIAAVVGTIKQVGWDYPKTKEDVEQIQKDIKSIPKSKQAVFNVEKGKKNYNFTQEFDIPNNYKVIFSQFNGYDFDVRKFQITENLRMEKSIRLTIDLELNSELQENKALKVDLLLAE